MHRIYFENRCIIICGPDEQALSDPNSVEFHFGGTISIHSLVAMFEASESLSRIYIPTDNTGWMYRKVCAEFREVDAAGGLVSNRRGDYLLIRRNGLWDLPKGHRENGEDITVTALREVQEETGVRHLRPVSRDIFSLEALTVDAAHIMENGVIVKNGGAELVWEVNSNGFGGIKAD